MGLLISELGKAIPQTTTVAMLTIWTDIGRYAVNKGMALNKIYKNENARNIFCLIVILSVNVIVHLFSKSEYILFQDFL